jgi:endonuclease YncB( thermonuclease family)
LTAVLPWLVVLAIAAGSALPLGDWAARLGLPRMDQQAQRQRDSDIIVQRAGSPAARYPVEVLYTVDGDTFDARIALWPGREHRARVRLRNIDAPELHAACEQELRKAEVSKRALRTLLGEGGVSIYNLGPDKYGRIVADAATRTTPNVSAALVAAGHARSYLGGQRQSWCDGAGP